MSPSAPEGARKALELPETSSGYAQSSKLDVGLQRRFTQTAENQGIELGEGAWRPGSHGRQKSRPLFPCSTACQVKVWALPGRSPSHSNLPAWPQRVLRVCQPAADRVPVCGSLDNHWLARQLAEFVDDHEAHLAGAGLEPIESRCLAPLTTAGGQLFDQLARKLGRDGVAAKVCRRQ